MDSRRAAGIAAFVAAVVAIGQGLVGVGIAVQGETFEWNGLFTGAVVFAIIALAPGAWLLATANKSSIVNPDPNLEVEELEPDRIPNWDNDWRVSIRVLTPVRATTSRHICSLRSAVWQIRTTETSISSGTR